jgi:hypothetical protein
LSFLLFSFFTCFCYLTEEYVCDLFRFGQLPFKLPFLWFYSGDCWELQHWQVLAL